MHEAMAIADQHVPLCSLALPQAEEPTSEHDILGICIHRTNAQGISHSSKATPILATLEECHPQAWLQF